MFIEIQRAISVTTIIQYWARDLPMIIGCIVCEIVLLGITAVRTACTIASEFGYRLYPLNQERYFVATALIRACFGAFSFAALHIALFQSEQEMLDHVGILIHKCIHTACVQSSATRSLLFLDLIRQRSRPSVAAWPYFWLERFVL